MPTDPDIAVSIACPAWTDDVPDAEAMAVRAAQAALAAGGLTAAHVEVSIVLSDDAAVRELNRDYRGRDRPTNVLSFPALDEVTLHSLHSEAAGDAPVLLGDVILAYETVMAEASSQQKAAGDHLAHLVVHGVLHLLGHDHAEEAEADRMEALETAILAGLGITDPYTEGIGEAETSPDHRP